MDSVLSIMKNTPSFSVTPAKQMYYCFGCGAGGNVFNFIMEYENFTFGEALKYLADRSGVELPKIEYSKEAKEKAERKAALLEINKQAAQYFYYQLRREGGKRAYQYLSGRGLSDETIRKFGLGYSDKYSDDLYRFLKAKITVTSCFGNQDFFKWMSATVCTTSSGTGLFFRLWM